MKFYIYLLIFTLISCSPMTFIPINKDQPSDESQKKFINEFLGKDGIIIMDIPGGAYKIPAGTKVKITNITYDNLLRFFKVEVTDAKEVKDIYYTMYAPEYKLPPFDEQLMKYIDFGDAKSQKIHNEIDSLANKVYWILPEIVSIEPQFKINPNKRVRIITARVDFSKIDITKAPPSFVNTFVIVEDVESGIRDSLNFRFFSSPNYPGKKQWEDFIEPRLSELSPEKRKQKALNEVKSHIANPVENSFLEEDPKDRLKLIELQKKYYDKIFIFAVGNSLISGGEYKTWATFNTDTNSAKIRFTAFKNHIYLKLPFGIYSVVFNNLRTDQNVRARIVFNELITKIIKNLNSHFGDEIDFDGYEIEFDYAHYNFLKEIEGELVTLLYLKNNLPSGINNDRLTTVLSRKECRSFLNFDITSQELVDKSFIILNGNRIKLSLEGYLR